MNRFCELVVRCTSLLFRAKGVSIHLSLAFEMRQFVFIALSQGFGTNPFWRIHAFFELSILRIGELGQTEMSATQQSELRNGIDPVFGVHHDVLTATTPSDFLTRLVEQAFSIRHCQTVDAIQESA